MEQLTTEVEEVLAQHNAEALASFLAYIRDYVLANAAELPPGNVLPWSRFVYPVVPAPDHDVPGPSNWAGLGVGGGALMQFQKEVLIASPFVALSGQLPQAVLLSSIALSTWARM